MRSVLLTCVLSAVAAAQDDLVVRPCGGGVGQTVTYHIDNGTPGAAFLLLTGIRRADLSLTWLDPGEGRRLGVALDLPSLNFIGSLDASGAATLALTVPNNPALAGLAVLHQCLTVPGRVRVIDEISEVAVVPIDTGGVFQQQSNVLASPRSFATSIPLRDGKLLVVGGAGGTLLWQTAWNTTEVYDPVTRAFTPGPTMAAARSSHTQTRLQDGRYLLTGGVDGVNVPQLSCEIYDPAAGTFMACASMSAVRAFHSASLLSDGRVLVAGGIQNMTSATQAVTSQTNTTEIYDPATDTWTAGPRLSLPRAAHAAVDLGNGKILLAGGLSYTSLFVLRIPNIQRTCDLYDHSTGAITRTGSMTTTRAIAGQFLLPDGRVLVAGGMSGDITVGGLATDLCEIFDPVTATWSAAAPLANRAALPTSIVLRDGGLAVVAGGKNTMYYPHPNDTTEVYDAVAGTWSSLPTLVTGRTAGLAVELQACGLVVIGGGTTNAATAVDTHELLVR